MPLGVNKSNSHYELKLSLNPIYRHGFEDKYGLIIIDGSHNILSVLTSPVEDRMFAC